MMRILGSSLLCALLFTSACSAAYADRAPRGPSRHDQALAIAPEAVRAIYNVNVEGEDGGELAMYARNGRYYVLGDAGDRYVVHVTNPAARRIEAVITVDGLDVIDGESGDLRKRGYVIQPYGDLKVEGFRTSTTDVATFRFSSVGDSYAERKGKGRNVGVIAVAIFEEQGPPEIVEPAPPPPVYDYRRDLDDEGDDARGSVDRPGAPSVSSRGGSHHSPTRTASRGEPAKEKAPAAAEDRSAAPPAPATAGANASGSGSVSSGYMPHPPADPCCTETVTRRERPGLGTEFGEAVSSPVQEVTFVRASASHPSVVLGARYNDREGLVALGIDVDGCCAPTDDLAWRSTATPFPGSDRRYAAPPAGWREGCCVRY